MKTTIPKYRVRNFSGMSDNGMYFLENMEASFVNGEGVLTPSLSNRYVLSEDSTNMSGLQLVSGMTQIYAGDSYPNILFIDNNGFIGSFYSLSSAAKKIHTLYNDASSYPDILATTNDNILFTTKRYIGVGYLGTATGGSATTLIDTTRNFTTTGISSSNGVNKVYNLTKGVEYTVTSVTTTTNTNDTINFSSSTAPTAGDYYVAFVETKFDLDTTVGSTHFKNQPTQSSWNRQIVQVNDRYYILNGNYLSRLNVDESTFTSNNKRLWYNMQGTCIGVNQNSILIGGYIRNKGVLLLWDGYTDGFQSYLEIDKRVDSITPYKDGWIFVSGCSIYYTNGYSITLMSQYPDTTDFSKSFNCRFNGLTTVNERIVINGNIGGSGRDMSGLFSFRTSSGWSYAPYKNSTRNVMIGSNGCIYKSQYINTPIIYSSFSDTNSTNNYCINSLLFLGNGNNTSTLYVKLQDKTRISKIELNLAYKYDIDNQTSSPSETITLNYGTWNNKLSTVGVFGSGDSSSYIANTNGNLSGTSGNVGDKIIVLNGNNSGDISYITEVSNKGTASEAWTISPSLSVSPQVGTKYKRLNLKKAGSITITDNIPESVSFDLNGHYSDKLIIEIVQSGNLPLDIHSINIYGE